MTKYPVRLRAGLSLVRINLESAKQYFQEANFHFDRQLRDLLAEDQDKPSSYWEEDLGGITRGDLGAERRMAIEGNQQLTRQFAVILAYSALERFLLLICTELQSSDSAPPIRRFDQIVKALHGIAIDLRTPRERSRELDRLRELRNAFAHQGGWVTSENVRRLQPFGYAENTWIELDADYFASACVLVHETCRDVARGYARHLGVPDTDLTY